MKKKRESKQTIWSQPFANRKYLLGGYGYFLKSLYQAYLPWNTDGGETFLTTRVPKGSSWRNLTTETSILSFLMLKSYWSSRLLLVGFSLTSSLEVTSAKSLPVTLVQLYKLLTVRSSSAWGKFTNLAFLTNLLNAFFLAFIWSCKVSMGNSCLK